MKNTKAKIVKALVHYGCFGAIGFVMSTAGINLSNWQFWVITFAAMLACETRESVK
jgi:hypothetical protein